MEFPRLEGKCVLAPMSGVSDVAFRVLCRRHGAAMTTTEFCSADGLIRANPGTLKQAIIAKEESPVAIQLFGSTIDTVKEAALVVQKDATVVDFNLGCPAWHVLSQGCGSAMLADPAYIEQLVREVSSVLTVPFTVKLRLGLSDSKRNFIEVARRCVGAGAVAVTLHARTTKQGYSGQADWSAIKELKESIDVPVIGNGDIFAPEDALRMLSETGCDYVMIGRGARNNPLIFEQTNQLLSEGSYHAPSREERIALFFEYLTLAEHYHLDLARMKSHAMNLIKGLEGAKAVRENISREVSLDSIVAALEVFRDS